MTPVSQESNNKPLNASDRSEVKAGESSEPKVDPNQKVYSNADILKAMMNKWKTFENVLTVFTAIILIMSHLVNNFGTVFNEDGGFIKC